MNGQQPSFAGEVRLNQLIFTFGIGSVIDLPHVAALVLGLDDWDTNRLTTIEEERLLTRVRAILGPQVQRLALPPMPAAEGMQLPGKDRWDDLKVGVPVAPFPRWMRCTACGLLASLDTGLFKKKSHPFRADRLRYEHENCQKTTSPAAVPARFLLACPRGHVQDFPWVRFVHEGKPCPRPTLRMLEFGVSGSTTEIMIKCDNCGTTRSMARAFDESYTKDLLTCDGLHPHLRRHEPCNESPNVILIGATNSWFPVTVNLLNLPSSDSELQMLIDDHWTSLEMADSVKSITMLRLANALTAFSTYSDEDIWQGIQKRKAEDPSESADASVKLPEWKQFCKPDEAANSRDFLLESTDVPREFKEYFDSVVLVKRLREVRALIGFTRLESPGDYGGPEDVPDVKRAPLSRHAPSFVPAAEVRGEGIFIRFKEGIVQNWLARVAVKTRDVQFRQAHASWRAARGIDPPEANYPGMRFMLIHAFTHALMRRIAIECGYSAASIRERIYAEPVEGEADMAGVLLYTSAPDSEGTLGGLVHLGSPSELGRLVRFALEDMKLCSSDPLCASHDPEPNGTTLHGAACHACLFSPETSRERGNRYLDRSLLVPVFGSQDAAFFNAQENDDGSKAS